MLDRATKLGLTGWGTIATIVASVIGVLAIVIPDGDSDTAPAAPIRTSQEVAEDFLQHFHAADWHGIWADLLHPAVQEAVPEDLYVRCQEEAGRPATLKSFKPDGLSSDAIDVPGIEQKTATYHGFQLVLHVPEGDVREGAGVRTAEFEGEPRYVFPQDDYEGYVAGACPSAEVIPLPDGSPGSLGDAG